LVAYKKKEPIQRSLNGWFVPTNSTDVRTQGFSSSTTGDHTSSSPAVFCFVYQPCHLIIMDTLTNGFGTNFLLLLKMQPASLDTLKIVSMK
jgi:hypothetical protein